MSTMPLLAHLAGRFVSQRENLATEALAYILTTSTTARTAALRALRGLGISLPEDLSFRTQAGSTDDAIPDLVGEDQHRNQRLTIEAKFWAGLTAAQPVGYIDRINSNGGGALVFLVPDKRVELVWHEVVDRAVQAELPIVERDLSQPTSRLADSGLATLAIISWSRLLGAVLSDVEGAGEHVTASNIRQLVGLCDREDAEAFLPFTPEELTSATLARRIIQVSDLADDLTRRLVQIGVADVKRLKAVGGKGWYGKYLRLHGVGSLLYFSAGKWGSKGHTPLWLRVTGTDWNVDTRVAEHLLNRCWASGIRAHQATRGVEVPINLPSFVERDRVLEAALKRLLAVAQWIEELGLESSDDGSSEPPTDTVDSTDDL